MSDRASRTLTVLSKRALTPNMLRIELTGDELSHFPEGYESGYVKLNVHLPNGKTCVRSYTVRAFDHDAKTLTLDFVLHGDNGPASAWAMHVKEGEAVVIDGPGPVKLVDMSADWFLICGDMTALPAISVNLERLPSHAKGYAVIEVASEADKQAINLPEGVTLQWLVNPQPDTPNTMLADAVMALPWIDQGRPYAWLACEFTTMRRLRRYFKQDRQVAKEDLYMSSYWKMGDSDEGHKAAKKADVDTD